MCRYSGSMDKYPKKMTFDQLLAESPELDGPTWTTEEAKLSTPYSERETWARIIMWDLVDGKSRFNGPDGLRAEMVQLLATTTVEDMRDRLLKGRPLTD